MGESKSKLAQARVLPPAWLPGRLTGALLPSLVPVGTIMAIGQVDWFVGSITLVLTAVAVVYGWTRIRARVHGEFTLPLHEASQIVDRMRETDAPLRIPDGGAQAVRNLARRINQSLGDAIENSQLSQAKLLSVEAAFDRIYAVLRTLGEGVIVVGGSSSDLVVLANPRARELFVDGGRPIEGRALVDLLPRELAEPASTALTAVRTGSTRQATLGAIELGKQVFDLRVVPLESTQVASNFGWLVVFTDVTKAREVARLKDEFLSSVSHEFRTPLTNIIVYAEILEQMVDEVEAKEFLAIIQSESERLHNLVDSVLEYAKLESGKVEWRAVLGTVDDVIARSLVTVRDAADERHVRIETIGTSVIPVLHDVDWLARGLAQVIDNAIKFGPEGGEVCVEVEDVADDHVVIRVHDQGAGVPDEHRGLIFERLRQLGDMMIDKPSGTGMGLSICASILERFGGSIRCVDSTRLGGACLEIELPRAGTADGEAHESAEILAQGS